MAVYDLGHVRRWVADLGARAGVPRRIGLLLARRMLSNEALGRHDEGLASFPELLRRLARGDFDAGAEPWISPLEEEQASVGLHAGRAIPALVLARAVEIAEQLARSRRAAQPAVVRIWGVEDSITPVVELTDLAIGPFTARSIGPGQTSVTTWPSGSGLPLIEIGDRSGRVDHLSADLRALLPPTPCPEPRGDQEIVIWARLIDVPNGLLELRDRLAPVLSAVGADEGSGFIHPDRLGRRREQAESGGISLPGGLAEQLAAWSRKLGSAPLLPAGSVEEQSRW